jgi:hypothetical protein
MKNTTRFLKFTILFWTAILMPHFAQAETITNPLKNLNINSVPELVLFLFKWSIIIAGIVATAAIIAAGYKLITANGNPKALGEAKNRLQWTVGGLALILLAYMVVNIISNALSGKITDQQDIDKYQRTSQDNAPAIDTQKEIDAQKRTASDNAPTTDPSVDINKYGRNPGDYTVPTNTQSEIDRYGRSPNDTPRPTAQNEVNQYSQ